MRIFRRLSDERGAALILATAAVLIMTIMGAVFVSITTSDYRLANGRHRTAEAFQLAEAGIEDFIDRFKTNDFTPTAVPSTALAGGTYVVTFSQPDVTLPEYTVLSTGNFLNRQQQVEIRLRSSFGGCIGEYALYSDSDIVFNGGGNSDIYGTVHTNGRFEFRGSAVAHDDIEAVGTINLRGSALCEGDELEGSPHVDMPTYENLGVEDHNEDGSVNELDLRWLAEPAIPAVPPDDPGKPEYGIIVPAGTTLSGLIAMPDETAEPDFVAIIYCDGQLTLDSVTIDRPTTIIARDIRIQGNSVIGDMNTSATIIGYNNVTMGGTPTVYGLVFAPGTCNIAAGGHPTVQGSVYAHTMTLNGQLDINFPNYLWATNSPSPGLSHTTAFVTDWH